MTSSQADRMQRRWIASLHEAGHALGSFAFSGEPGSAQLRPLGGGSASSLEHLPHAARAIALAAGAAAEVLAERVAPPLLTPEGEFRWELQRTVARQDAAREGAARPAYAVPGDSVQLGFWAVESDPDSPEGWAGRVAWARAQATGFVADNAGGILALARRLFDRGRIGPEDFQALGLEVQKCSPQPPAEPAKEVE